jgi:acyl carrier protein
MQKLETFRRGWMANINEEVRTFISDNFMFGEGATIEDDTSFLEKGIIDSTGILEVISHLESFYKIKIEDDELLPENLDSVNNIVRFIGNKIAGLP